MKNKKLTIFLIVLLSILVVGIVLFMISILTNKIKLNKFRFSDKVSNELVLEEEYTTYFDKINIESEAGDIYIYESTDDKVKVIIYGDKNNTLVDTKNNQLRIESHVEKCIGFCFNQTISKIEVYLPSDYDKEISIENNYGDIEIENFNNAEIDIDEDCGNITIDSVDNLKIDNDYGNVEIGRVNDANIEVSSGEIKINSVDNLTLNCDLGDIDIENVNNYLSIESDLGDVTIDQINLNRNSSIKSDLGNVKIGKTNEIYIDATGDLGDIDITNNYRESNITLEIEVDLGDVDINN